jgi:hypothetical protein
MIRLCHLNEKVRDILSSNPKFGSLIYVMVSYFVKEHYAKQRNSTIYELVLTFLIEFTSKKTLCASLNQLINESVVIAEIPVVSGSSADLLFVVMSHLVTESLNFDPYLYNLIAIMRNM